MILNFKRRGRVRVNDSKQRTNDNWNNWFSVRDIFWLKTGREWETEHVDHKEQIN